MWWIVIAAALAACGRSEPDRSRATVTHDAASAADPWAAQRAAMVDTLAARGVRDPRVLAAMRVVARHELVPEASRADAYADRPLPIGWDQTISQPYVVAVMTEAAQLAPGERVLEVGTGSGYQAMVLAELGVAVYSIEIVEPLATQTAATLARLGYGPERIALRIGDGYQGWPDAAPFDAIIVTAAPPAIPPPLVEQLAIGGRLVIPVGERVQDLKVVTRTAEGVSEETLFGVLFVPMTGEAQRAR